MRGHLNVLSARAFAELCDLYSRLTDINKSIDETNKTLLQADEMGSNRESALSDLKRKYSKLALDYCKQFYLTPAATRGNLGLEEENSSVTEKENGTERFF